MLSSLFCDTDKYSASKRSVVDLLHSVDGLLCLCHVGFHVGIAFEKSLWQFCAAW